MAFSLKCLLTIIIQVSVLLTLTVEGQKKKLFNPLTAPAVLSPVPRVPVSIVTHSTTLPFVTSPFTRNPFLHGGSFLGGNHNFNHLNRGFNPHANGFRQEELYTAIGYDRLDPNSQMRLTITERRPSGYPGFSLPGLDWDDDDDDFDRPASWYVQGTFLTSQVRNKAGSYHVVLTKGGRTADGCVGESLGEIMTPDFLPMNNPYLGHQQQYGPGAQIGIMPNKLLIGSSGPTVYASTLDGVSRRQLVGSAIAACENIFNGVCTGYIPFCATVGKDLLPAMEVPLGDSQPGVRVVNFDPLVGDFNRGDGGFIALSDAGPTRGDISFQDDDESSLNVGGLLF